MNPTNELILAQIWNARWLRDDLRLRSGESLRVVYPGVWTHGFGPDFTGAFLDVAGRLVQGDVEVHRTSSSWPAHGHDRDPAYNAVVLHVVLADDRDEPVRCANGRSVPTLQLDGQLPGPLASFAAGVVQRPLGSIGFEHCAPLIAAEQPERLRAVWEQEGDRRMIAKQATVSGELALQPPGQVLYARLADALGYSRNRSPMAAVAERLPLRELDARLALVDPSRRSVLASALLLGVGGFLPLSPGDLAISGLSPAGGAEIEALWHRHGRAWAGRMLAPTEWSLGRVRPAAHPLRRLLSLAELLGRSERGLIDELCDRLLQPDARRALLDWLVGRQSHLGRDHAHEILVNVVVPFALAYGEWVDQEPLSRAASRLWLALPAGRGNAVTRQVLHQICGETRVEPRSARAEQGLLQLRRTGCALMRCHECPVAALALLGPAVDPEAPGAADPVPTA